MQTIEDWECHDPTVSLRQSRHGLLLAQALMWPSLVVEADVLRDEAQKMALAKHEDRSGLLRAEREPGGPRGPPRSG
jgi:hypothetical protein